MTIKDQALIDFIAKFTYNGALEPKMTLSEVKNLEKQVQEDDLSRWTLFMDGSSN